ncbi:MAG: C4-type zinc ribbon domain-containing protein [Treponema sp.]|nr:C4-type zinc ribbon domain-containing protein [Treponema sp.]
MVTADIFEKLKDLQDILVNKYELEAKIEEAPKHIGIQEELLAKLKKEYIEKNTSFEELKAKIGGLKVEYDQAVKLREDSESGMETATEKREIEALDNQIKNASAKEDALRKELQQEEKTLQAMDEALKCDEDMIKSQEDDISAAKKSIDNEIAKYNNELAMLQEKESKITPSLDQEILFKFERIIQRNAEGIVAVRNGVCTGCHMILPAQFANTVREGENILFCPYCSRILCYEESEDTENFYSMDEAGSLADLDGTDGEEDDTFDEDDENDSDFFGKDEDFADDDDEADDSDLDEEEPEEDAE